MRKLLLLLTLIVFAGSQLLWAQSKTISGTITGQDDGMPIPGAAIAVKGTTMGTVSDGSGKYQLSVPADATTLVVSFIGMKAQEVEIGARTTINVALQSEAIGLEEVIAVAYGTATKKAFTGTATQVKADKIEAKSVSNITQALSGEVAGVQVISSNGQPGSTAAIRIRGIGSINGSRDPLYIVDGVPLQGDINSISPADIASTTVLKDASATAIYGSRGANGVVIITTKKGKEGQSSIEVDIKHGVNMRLLPEYDVYTKQEEYVEQAWSALRTRGLVRGNADPATYANTYLFNDTQGSPGINTYYNMWDQPGAQLIDPSTGKFNTSVNRKYTPEKWRDELFQNAKRTEGSVRLSGGNDKTTFFTSFNVLKDEGYYINSDYERFTGRANVDHQIRSWLKGNVNMSFMQSESNLSGGQDSDSNNGFWFVANMPPIFPVFARDASGNKVVDTRLGGYVYDYGDGKFGTRRFASLTNAVASSSLDVNRTNNKQFSGNSKLEATFLKNFTLSNTFGLEYLHQGYDNLGNMFWGGSAAQGGSIYKRQRDWYAFTTTNMLRYKNSFDKHNLDVFVAHEASQLEFKNMSAFKSNLADPWNLELNNAVVSSPSGSYLSELMLLSYFAQATYDFDEKYYFQGVLRRDGSSKFINEKWGTFWSVGGGWLVSREAFMESTADYINELKLKASYGVIGEQGGIGNYASYDLYSVDNQNDKISITESHVGNRDLTWEEAKQFQVGAEFKVFNRINGSVDYYIKDTENLLFEQRVAPSHGYAIIQVNDGKMRNSGLEVSLDAELYNSNDLKINLAFNASFEKNEIKAMPKELGTGQQKVLDLSGAYGRSVGHSLYDFYMPEYAGVNPATGRAQWYRYYNEVNSSKDYIADMTNYLAQNKGNIGTIGREITEVYSEATDKYIGKSPIPVVRGAFNLNAEYKGFSLTALFNYSLGGYGYDENYAALMADGLIGGNNWHKDIAKAWKNPGDITDVPAITGGTSSTPTDPLANYSQANSRSDRFVTKTDFLALNNVRLSYDFSKRILDRIGLKGLKLFVSGDNLYVTTKRQGFYPNTSEVGASSTYQYVPLTNITGGINIKF